MSSDIVTIANVSGFIAVGVIIGESGKVLLKIVARADTHDKFNFSFPLFCQWCWLRSWASKTMVLLGESLMLMSTWLD